MTYWETFKKIENETGRTKCGLSGLDVSVWLDNVFIRSGRIQDQEMQVIFSNKDHNVKHYRVWENDIFIVAESKGV